MELSTDVMQVCRNGHVITEQLRSDPVAGASHCDRCGARTLHQCETCGQELSGISRDFGLVPVGNSRPPLYCANCGVPFPWAGTRGHVPPSTSLPQLEMLLRRLPRVIRQFRSRHGERPPFRVEDQRDLEDLLRALLFVQFDPVRPECRTPSYSAATQTDFLLGPCDIALVAKRATTTARERQIADQIAEDVAYYRQRQIGTLVIFTQDPEGLLRESRQLEASWSRAEGEPQVRCVIAG